MVVAEEISCSKQLVFRVCGKIRVRMYVDKNIYKCMIR